MAAYNISKFVSNEGWQATITKKAEYAVSVLVELATRQGEGYISAREVAQRRGIPPKFIGQVAAVLSRRGWVEGVRGPSGGLRLLEKASRISVRDVLALIEGPLGISKCLVDEEVCEGRSGCPLRGVWAKAQKRMLEVLEDTTIADLVAAKRVMRGGTGVMGNAGEEIMRAARTKEVGGGNRLEVISVADVARISERCGLSKRDVEIVALEAGVVPARYTRNMGTIGREGQLKLLRSKVFVAGAGGLGGTVVELLARVGVGHIVVADKDSFEDDNLNRQLLCTENNLELPKAGEAVRRAAEINSSSVVEGVTDELVEGNLDGLLLGATVAVDCLDNFPARRALEAACRRRGVPLVHGAIAGFVGQIMTVFPGDAGVSCLYGSPQGAPERGIEAVLGNPSPTPTMVAAWQVQEVVKIITGRGSPLRNRLLFLDAESGQVELLALDPGPARAW